MAIQLRQKHHSFRGKFAACLVSLLSQISGGIFLELLAGAAVKKPHRLQVTIQ